MTGNAAGVGDAAGAGDTVSAGDIAGVNSQNRSGGGGPGSVVFSGDQSDLRQQLCSYRCRMKPEPATSGRLGQSLLL